MASFRDCARKMGLSKEVEEFLAGDGDPGATDEFRRQLGQKHQEALVRKYQANLQEIAVNDALDHIAADPRTAREAARGFYSVDDRRTGRSGVEQQVLATQNYYLAQFADSIEMAQNGKFVRRLKEMGDDQNPKLGRDVTREAFGQGSGNQNARVIYDQFATVAENLRQAINQAGGNIKKLNTWYLPQRHSSGLLMKGGVKGSKGLKDQALAKQQWIDFIEPLIKPFTDDAGNPVSLTRTREILESSYDAITTNGMSRRNPADISGQGKLANRHQETRSFHFKDADAWLKYADEYGESDVMQSMIQYIQDMSKDLGLLQTMGPDPDATHRAVMNAVRKDQAGQPKLRDRRGTDQVDNIWMNINGIEPSGNQLGAAVGGTARGLASTAKLGGAFISSIPDPAYAASSVVFNGTGMGRWGKRWIRQFTPGLRKMDQSQAKAMGYMTDQVVDEMRGLQRFMDPEVTNIMHKLNTGLHKASLLTPWERGNRTAFKMAMVDGVSEAVGKGRLSEAKPRMKYLAKRAGIDEADWAALRKARNPAQGNLIDLTKIDDPALVRKWGGIVESESAGAIIMPTARTRAVMNQGAAPGTVKGEMARFTMQWKSHPVGYTQTQLYRLANTAIGRHSEIGAGFSTIYAMNGVVTLGILGSMAVQAKEVAKGRTPLPMETERDWLNLLSQGLIQAGAGGLWYESIYGVLFNGRSPFTLLTPPTLQAVDEILGMGIFADVDQEGMKALDGRLSEYLGGAAVRSMAWVPGQSLWYLRAAWEQVAMQAVADQISPEEAKRMENRAKRIKRERGQEELLR